MVYKRATRKAYMSCLRSKSYIHISGAKMCLKAFKISTVLSVLSKFIVISFFTLNYFIILHQYDFNHSLHNIINYFTITKAAPFFKKFKRLLQVNRKKSPQDLFCTGKSSVAFIRRDLFHQFLGKDFPSRILLIHYFTHSSRPYHFSPVFLTKQLIPS